MPLDDDIQTKHQKAAQQQYAEDARREAERLEQLFNLTSIQTIINELQTLEIEIKGDNPVKLDKLKHYISQYHEKFIPAIEQLKKAKDHLMSVPPHIISIEPLSSIAALINNFEINGPELTHIYEIGQFIQNGLNEIQLMEAQGPQSILKRSSKLFADIKTFKQTFYDNYNNLEIIQQQCQQIKVNLTELQQKLKALVSLRLFPNLDELFSKACDLIDNLPNEMYGLTSIATEQQFIVPLSDIIWTIKNSVENFEGALSAKRPETYGLPHQSTILGSNDTDMDVLAALSSEENQDVLYSLSSHFQKNPKFLRPKLYQAALESNKTINEFFVALDEAKILKMITAEQWLEAIKYYFKDLTLDNCQEWHAFCDLANQFGLTQSWQRQSQKSDLAAVLYVWTTDNVSDQRIDKNKIKEIIEKNKTVPKFLGESVLKTIAMLENSASPSINSLSFANFSGIELSYYSHVLFTSSRKSAYQKNLVLIHDLSGSNWKGAKFANVTFYSCNFNKANFNKVYFFFDAEFTACNFINANLSQLEIPELGTISNSSLDHAIVPKNFQSALLRVNGFKKDFIVKNDAGMEIDIIDLSVPLKFKLTTLTVITKASFSKIKFPKYKDDVEKTEEKAQKIRNKLILNTCENFLRVLDETNLSLADSIETAKIIMMPSHFLRHNETNYNTALLILAKKIISASYSENSQLDCAQLKILKALQKEIQPLTENFKYKFFGDPLSTKNPIPIFYQFSALIFQLDNKPTISKMDSANSKEILEFIMAQIKTHSWSLGAFSIITSKEIKYSHPNTSTKTITKTVPPFIKEIYERIQISIEAIKRRGNREDVVEEAPYNYALKDIYDSIINFLLEHKNDYSPQTVDVKNHLELWKNLMAPVYEDICDISRAKTIPQGLR